MGELSWRPQAGPQKALIDCPIPIILHGGARGGGKTDAILGKYGIKDQLYGGAFNGVFFRREMPQQDDLIERAKEIYMPTGAEWYEQRKMFRLAHGGRLRFRPLENTADAEKYQGQNMTDAAVEEAGNYPSPDPIWRLMGCLRSTTGVPTQLLLTANPGGPGHQWIKHEFIDPAPLGNTPIVKKLPSGNGVSMIFIPSRVTDNRILMTNDPSYVDRLHLVGSPELVRAWLEGDWNVTLGAFFPEFGPQHIIAPRELPDHWLRFRAKDWGSAKPFCVGWYAVSDGELNEFPRGALIKYREWYGSNGQPNVGLKMTAEQVADGIRERERPGEVSYGRADPSMFAQDGGPSLAERMMARGVVFAPADNKRVAQRGAMGGWDQLRARLVGEDGRPMIYFFATCRDTIRTLPALQHDPDKPEDLDTESEDHAADETRYACMSRPYVPVQAKPPAPKLIEVGGLTTVTMNDLWRTRDQKRVARV